MLLGNLNCFNANPGRSIGGLPDPTYWMKGGSIPNFYLGYAYVQGVTDTSNFTESCSAPYNYGFPIRVGGLRSGLKLSGEGYSTSARLWAGKGIGSNSVVPDPSFSVQFNLVAQLRSNSVVPQSSGSASIKGSVNISGSTSGSTSSTCTLSDGITRVNIQGSTSGSVSATAQMTLGKGISGNTNGYNTSSTAMKLVANVRGNLNCPQSTGSLSLIAKAFISGELKLFTELSPESLATSVWNTLATDFNEPGTFGNKLNLASSGGIDYDTLVNSIWNALVSSHTDPSTMGGILELLKSKISDLHKIQGLDKDNPMTVTKTQQASGDVVLELSGDGEELTIVTRQ
jgi:hypothetical protein